MDWRPKVQRKEQLLAKKDSLVIRSSHAQVEEMLGATEGGTTEGGAMWLLEALVVQPEIEAAHHSS